MTRPIREVRRQSAGVRWCFGCRKRLEHTDILLDHVEPTHVGPWWRRECSGCGKDRTHFPGCGPR